MDWRRRCQCGGTIILKEVKCPGGCGQIIRDEFKCDAECGAGHTNKFDSCGCGDDCSFRR